MYAKIQNNTPVEWPVHGFQIRSAMTNVSLPVRLTPEDVAPFGFEPYTASDAPEFNTLTQKVEERTPVKQDGTWAQQWEVVELYSGAELEQVLAQAEADKLEVEKSYVRAERDDLLVQSDWTQVIDAPVDQAAWATYRQALRDITAQSGFPWTIDWPTQPA